MPKLVFGRYLRSVGCEVVRIPPGSMAAGELIDSMLEAGVALGRLQQALFEARAPDSPGGEQVTAEEQEILQRRLAELIRHLAELREQLRQRGLES